MDINKKEILNQSEEIEKIDKSYLWKTFISEAGENFIINDANKNIIYTILMYFCGLNDFDKLGVITNNPSLEKGILIYGNAGVGKTMLFEIIKRVGKRVYQERGIKKMLFNNISCGSFVNLFMMSSRDNPLEMNIETYFKGKRLYIDDLGIEPLCFNSYELMEQVLFERERNNAVTYCTTNMMPEGIKEKYGFRVGDRLKSMFNIIEWRGSSLRN